MTIFLKNLKSNTVILSEGEGRGRERERGRLRKHVTPRVFVVFFFFSLGEGNGNPLQYSCLENPKDGGAWQATVHGVATSWIQLSDFTFTFHFHA